MNNEDKRMNQSAEGAEGHDKVTNEELMSMMKKLYAALTIKKENQESNQDQESEEAGSSQQTPVGASLTALVPAEQRSERSAVQLGEQPNVHQRDRVRESYSQPAPGQYSRDANNRLRKPDGRLYRGKRAGMRRQQQRERNDRGYCPYHGTRRRVFYQSIEITYD